MNEPLFEQAPLDEAVAALREDVLAGQISTMRNYRFAILPYDPSHEFKLRQRIHQLTHDLKAGGWAVLPVSLQKLLIDRIRALGPDVVQSMIDRERRLYAKDPERALAHLHDRIAPQIEREDGIAADVVRCIDRFVAENPNHVEKTLVLIGRVGALYPFFRTSTLLRHIDGKTHQLPVVLLYPGRRRDLSALSFMGELPADRDYRPRIYP